MRIRQFLLTQAELKEILRYEPETGAFTWNRQRKNGALAGDVAGHVSGEGYWAIGIGGVHWQAHRVAWFYVHGEWPQQLVDHINQNKLDNRMVNLRKVTISENRQNMGKYKTNTSGHKGVHWFRATERWQAQIQHEGKRYHLGFYKRIEDAVQAYAKGAARLHQFNPAAATAQQ